MKRELLEMKYPVETHVKVYTTMNTRTIMWRLRMKPLKKEYWEEGI